MIAAISTWASRFAHRLIPDAVARLPSDSWTVYLTFDDGPSAYSDELLKMLAESQVRATFFLRGDRIAHHGDAARSIVDSGHGVGHHSYSHLDAWRNSWSEVEMDLSRGANAVSELLGRPVRWMRPPYGRFRVETLAWCRRNDQRMALWDVMVPDFTPSVSEEKAVAVVHEYVRPGSIIVMHDAEEHHPLALSKAKRIIYELKRTGWKFAPLPES